MAALEPGTPIFKSQLCYSCVALSKELNLSEPHFSRNANMEDDTKYI